MSDEHDPVEGRIDEGFDRLRSDSRGLDAMAPLRVLRERRGSLPWARIALGGGLVAAVLVLVGVFAFGGDDEPEEIVAGPELTTGQELLESLQGEWVFIGGSSADGDIVVDAADIPTTVQARHTGSGEDPVVLEGGVTFVVGEALRQDFVGGQFSVPFLLTYGGCLDYRGEIIDDPEVGQVIPTVELVRERCRIDTIGPLPKRFFDVLATTTTINVSDGDSMTMLGSRGVLTFARVTDADFRLITDTVTDLDDQPALPIPLTGTVADLDDRTGTALLRRLPGTYWELAAGGPDIRVDTPWRPFRLEFPVEDRVFIMGMCSWFGGEIVDGPRPFAQVESTEVANECPAELEATDATFLGMLESVDGAFVDQGGPNDDPGLFLTTADRDLIFVPERLDLDALTGVRWELDGWDLGADGSLRPPDAPAWFEMRPPFDADAEQPSGTVRGTTGCLEIWGLWRLVANQIVFTTELDFDPCGDDIPEQDLQVSYAIGTGIVPRLLGDTVTMYSTRDLEASVFRRGDPIEIINAPLEGTTWRLVSLGSPMPVPGDITITFDGERFSGRGPCNGYGDDYTLDGETFATGDIPQTLEGCDNNAVEADYLRTLREADRLRIDSGLLVISSGGTDLIFEPNTN